MVREKTQKTKKEKKGNMNQLLNSIANLIKPTNLTSVKYAPKYAGNHAMHAWCFFKVLILAHHFLLCYGTPFLLLAPPFLHTEL